MANGDRKIAEKGPQIEAICVSRRERGFGQPILLGLPKTIVGVFARDELSYQWVKHY